MKNFTISLQNKAKDFLQSITLLLLLLISQSLIAQKVIIIGATMDIGAADEVAFVVNIPLVAGEVVFINDYEYNTTTHKFGDAGAGTTIETIIKYITPSGGLAKGQVVTINITSQTTLAIDCSSGSNCGTATLINPAGTNGFRSPGESVYAYADSDNDPTNGVTEIYSVFYLGDEAQINPTGGTIPAAQNPVADYANAVVIDGFPATAPLRTEFNGNRAASVSKAILQNTSNYAKGASSAIHLDKTAFTSLNLVGANPILTMAVSPSSVTENGASNLVYTFTLSANATSNITVNFSVGGTATFDTDYTKTNAGSFTSIIGTVTIPNGSNTASITINPTGDATLEPDETVILTIASGTGYDGGSPSSATGIITNDDTGASSPLVALVGINQADIGINPTHLDGFSFVALNDITSGTVVHFTRRLFDKSLLVFNSTYFGTLKWTAGSGVNKGDVYTIMETSTDIFTVTCSDGSSCGTATNIDAGFAIPSSGIGLFAYKDNNDVPTDGITEIYSVLFTGDLTVGSNGGTISTTQNPTSVYPNAVVVDNFPNATPGRTEFKFAPGSTLRQNTVDRSLLTNVNNWLTGQSTATAPSTERFINIIVISGTANPLLTVAVSPTSRLENSGSTMVYTFTLASNATSNITVNFTVGGTATLNTDYTQTGATSFTTTTGSIVIPIGSNSASVTVTPTGDGGLEPDETVILALTSGTGYDAGNPNQATGTITNDDFVNVNPLAVVVGVNHGTTTDPDGFSFAANQNLVAGTGIYFTNAPFNNTSLAFKTGQFVTKYTVATGGLAKGQVVYVVETGTSTNAFTVSCSAGSNCGTFTFISGNFAIFNTGDYLYAYNDTDVDPTNGVSSIYSLFYTMNSTLPTTANPNSVYPNAVVVSSFGNSSPNRTEYKFASNERSAPINLVNIQNIANYLIGQSTQALSVIPFSALSLCPASIATNPSNAITCAGANTSFTVTASGSGLTYQWKVNTGSGFTNIVNGGIYSGATSVKLTLTAVPFANNGFTYQCVLNDCATSTAATLTVNATPTASPSSNTPVCAGGTLNLSSSAATSYLWSGPNTFTSSQQNPVINTVTSASGGTYTLRVTNAGGCTGTATTAVVINTTLAPTSPTATPSSRTTTGSSTLSASGCSNGTLTWYDASTNVAVPSPNNQPNFTSQGIFNFYAKCTGANTCVSDSSPNVSVTVTLCTPLASSPGNVNITWTGLVSTDWNTACNWNPAWVPDVSNTKAIIPNTTNKPIVTGTVPELNSIDVNFNALLTVGNGGTLNIRENGGTNKAIRISGGTLTNNGTINIRHF